MSDYWILFSIGLMDSILYFWLLDTVCLTTGRTRGRNSWVLDQHQRRQPARWAWYHCPKEKKNFKLQSHKIFHFHLALFFMSQNNFLNFYEFKKYSFCVGTKKQSLGAQSNVQASADSKLRATNTAELRPIFLSLKMFRMAKKMLSNVPDSAESVKCNISLLNCKLFQN